MAGEDAADLFDLGAVRPDEEFTQCYSGECRVNLLPTLYRLNHAISNATDLSAPLGMILEVMRAGMRMDRGAVSLLDRRRGRVFIHDSFGLTEEEERRGVYALGEGITGKVVESGKVIKSARSELSS